MRKKNYLTDNDNESEATGKIFKPISKTLEVKRTHKDAELVNQSTRADYYLERSINYYNLL